MHKFIILPIFLCILKIAIAQNCVATDGILVISTGKTVGLDVNLQALYKFPKVSNLHEVYVGSGNYWNLGGSGGQGENPKLFIEDSNGVMQADCGSNGCSLPVNQPNFYAGITIDIHYNFSGTQFMTLQAPVIYTNYKNYLADYQLSDQYCIYMNSIHPAANPIGSVEAMDCICCLNTKIINCPNIYSIPPKYWPKNVSIDTTFTPPIQPTQATGPMSTNSAGTVNLQTTTSTTDIPIVNCTNPQDPIVKVYCDLYEHKYQEPPWQVADNITNSITPANLTGFDIFLLSQIMKNLSSTQNLTNKDFQAISRMTDVILDASMDSFEESNNGDFGSTLTFLKGIFFLMRNSPNNVSFLTGSNLGLVNHDLDCSKNDGDTSMGDFDDRFLSNPSKADAMISIPTNVVCQKQRSQRLFYSIYRNTKLFVGNDSHSVNAFPSASRSCDQGFYYDGNKVLSGTLLNNDTVPYQGMQYVENDGVRQKIVVLKYAKEKTIRPLHGDLKITWWTGFLWSSETCVVKEEGNYWVSECDHLTDFTMIVDGLQKDPSLCSTPLEAISYIVYVGSMLSLIVLGLCFILPRISYFTSYIPAHTHLYGGRQQINIFTFLYNTWLLLFYFIFGFFSNENNTSGPHGCQAVAIMSYWLLLSCIVMTMFQAWIILKAFTWSTQTENMMRWMTHKIAIFAAPIALPTILALISGLSVKKFFDRDDNLCWIRADYVAFAVVIPITVLVLNAFFVITIITLRLFPKICGVRWIRINSHMIGKRPKKNEKLLALFIMQFTLGVPWILQYLSLFTPHVTASHYLFTLINGSQGMILLFIYLFKRYQLYKHQKYKEGQETSDTRETDTRNRTSTGGTEIENRINHVVGMEYYKQIIKH